MDSYLRGTKTHRTYMYVLLIALRCCYILAQSVDEEGFVHMEEGSGKFVSDDEDIEGSSIPRDANYATTPVVHPKLTLTTSTRWKTNVVKYPSVIQTQRVTTFATSASNFDIETTGDENSISSQIFFFSNTTLVIIGLLVIVITVISAVICFKWCSSRTKAYTPGQHRSSAALLKLQQ